MLALAVLVGLTLTGASAHAAFPGQNGRIACDGARGPAPPSTPPPAGFGRAEVYTMDPDGANVRVLTNNTADDVDPAWSPDGTKLSFDSLRDSSALEIYTMSPDGTGVRRLTVSPAEDRRTSWSPDGRIAFQTGRDTNFNIYTMNGTDGSGQRGLTVDPTQDTQPAWSPDGAKIAYRSSRQGNQSGDIFTMDPEVGETKDLRNVTNSLGVGDFAPHFSPDSRQIAFQATLPNGSLAIYRMNADGTGPATFLTTVTLEAGKRFSNNESNPAWSPDGTRIVFHSDRDRDPSSTDPAVRDNVEVYTMNAADGSDVKRLTNNPGFDGRCDWGRVRPAVAPPVYYDIPPDITPRPGAGKLRTSLTLKARPGRDRRPPFRFAFSGRVRVPSGANRARVCGGRVRLVVKKRRRTVARGSARVSRRCTYKKRITIRSTRRTGRRKARLRVNARFGGNAALKASKRSTTVRIF